MDFEFDWDEKKARSNLKSHGVSFKDAMSVFADPLADTYPDPCSVGEERWITLNETLLVVHTWVEIDPGTVYIRIISARHPTAHERRSYREGM